MNEEEVLELMGAIQPDMLVVGIKGDWDTEEYVPTSREEQYKLALESIERWVHSDQAKSHVLYAIHRVAKIALEQ